MTAPLGPTQKIVSDTVIGAAKMAGSIAGAPVTQKVIVGTTHALVDNKVGKWGANQVENIADRVASAPAVQQAAAKAEGLVTNVLNSSPVVKDLAVGLFSKVRSFIRAANLKSPPVKAFQMGEDALDTLQSGGTMKRAIQDTIGNLSDIQAAVKPNNNELPKEALQEAFGFGHRAAEMIKADKSEEEFLQEAKLGFKILKDTMATPASQKPVVQDLELKAKVLGVELRATDNEDFADSAFKAIIGMNSKGIEVPPIRLSGIFPMNGPSRDTSFINPETMPVSKAVIFFNANADWKGAAQSSQKAHASKWQITPSPEHAIYHAVGRTMYNGSAGSEILAKSNAMPEDLRLKIQGQTAIDTPEDFMGEMLAHIMVNGRQKEFDPYYNIYRNWGGQFPKDFNGGAPLPLPQRPLPKAPSPLDFQA